MSTVARDFAFRFWLYTFYLKTNTIISELLSVEGKEADIGGYYHPDDKKAEAAMRPSPTLNKIIESI